MPTIFYGDYDDSDEVRFKFEMKNEKSPLFIVGINPSNALADPDGSQNALKEDQTMKKIIGFSKRNWNYDKTIIEFDGFVMLNVYAQIADKAKNLPPARDIKLHKKNLKKIAGYLHGKQHTPVLLAYGDSITDKPYLKQCLRDIIAIFRIHDAHFFRLGELTTEGNPRHPLMLSYDTSLIEIGDNELELILK